MPSQTDEHENNKNYQNGNDENYSIDDYDSSYDESDLNFDESWIINNDVSNLNLENFASGISIGNDSISLLDSQNKIQNIYSTKNGITIVPKDPGHHREEHWEYEQFHFYVNKNKICLFRSFYDNYLEFDMETFKNFKISREFNNVCAAFTTCNKYNIKQI